ncbi:hypothetical protein [Clostridium luticellarii]|uniref:Uncharacterized protein n=1 Tax=Clostridium luticellarii TaxID=1691940 RepID=A0A2T0BQ17_9CLOT|nr:hypothetical protein [Clostridium luticellarii]PRR85968.1 hypothetical protein CLLU_09960 [Clostridium luticellarii]
MITAERRKKDIKWSIDQNPIEISFTKTIKKLVNGHLEEIKDDVTLTVRIFPQKTYDSSINVSTSTIGTSYQNTAYGMLADSEADLSIDSKSSIEFDCSYGHMKIKNVYPQIVNGEICGYDCGLEKVM